MSLFPVGQDGDDRIAYLFVDVETTGNRVPSKYGAQADQVWDIAWTLELGDTLMLERQLFVKHTTKPSQWVLDNTEYLATQIKIVDHEAVEFEPLAVCSLLASDIATVQPAQVHLVGANPAFDQEMINAMGMVQVAHQWHYRIINIEDRVAGRFNLATNPGLRECAELMGLPKPPKSHTARGDVKMTRWLFWEFRRACAEGRI